MEHPTTPDPQQAAADATAAAGSAGGWVPSPGRWRDYTPLTERSQRMHQFTGRLLAGVADATAGGSHGVGGVGGVAIGCLNAREAGESVLELREVISRLRGLELALLAHADTNQISSQVDGPAPVDTAAWLAHRGLVPGRTARTAVRLSRDLQQTYPATGSALLAGDVDAAQAEIIVWAVRRLPADLDPSVRERAEKVMLEEARHLDAVQLRAAGHRLLEVIAPEEAEATEAARLRKEEDAAAAATWFTAWDDGKGLTHVSAKLPTRHADMLRKALHAIANPALSEAIRRTVGTTDPAADQSTTGAGDSAAGANGAAMLKPGQRVLGEAFCRLLETLDPNRLPHSGGMFATVMITIPLQTLEGGLAAATMDTGTRLTPGEARRIACDAGLHPVVLGGKSEPLDYGRTRRLFSTAQRAVMAMRQRFRCAAEGCDRPTAWCDAHHLDPWGLLGKTNIDDGVLICARHHTLAHHPDYTLTRRPGWAVSISRTPRDTPRRH